MCLLVIAAPPGGAAWTVTFDVTVPVTVQAGPICFTLIYNSGLAPVPWHPHSWSFRTSVL